VPGYGGGDRWPALLEGGEAIVPKHLTPAVAPFLKAHGVPGFSQGLVPSYAGSPGGLPPWIKGNDAATIALIDRAVVNATLTGMSAMSTPGFGIAPSGALTAYARKLLSAYGWASQWAAFNDIVMRESGWNVYATNPTSGAYGIPQALPGYKMASAGADWRTNGFTQLRWMMGYLASRWGSPLNADINEQANHWYGQGLAGGIFTRPTIIGVGDRGPEQVTVTPLTGPDRSQAQVVAALQQVIALLRAQPAQTGKAFGDALNGVSRSAAYSGRYGTR
jgi:hypothetical protein